MAARNVLHPRRDHDDEYDFVELEQPSHDFFCPVTFDVLLEPCLTECCGNHLSETAYQRLQGKPCPMCKEERLTAVKDKYHKRRVSSLKVRCPHKAEGCEWEGELGSLEQHLNAKSPEGECRYVDVKCLCGESFKRRSLEEHVSQHCLQRPFSCKYCKHKDTFQVVTEKHWPVCKKYPLPCPKKCGEKEIERQHLKGHLQTCPVEVIQCEFSYAGCGAKLQRRLMSAHMKENIETHLSFLAQKVPELNGQSRQQGEQIKLARISTKQQEEQIQQQGAQIKQQGEQIKQQGEQIKQQGDTIKQQGDQIKQQAELIKQKGDLIKQQGDKFKQQGVMIKMQEDKIKQQADQMLKQRDLITKQQGDQQGAEIKQQGDRMKRIIEENRMLLKVLGRNDDRLVVPPLEFIMEEFEKHRINKKHWYSLPFYSHLGGYKMRLKVEVNGYSNVCVYVCLMKGEFDDELSWPLNGTITIQHPRKRTFGFSGNKPKDKSKDVIGYDLFYISYAELYKEREKFLINGSLTFHVSEVRT